MRGWEPLTLCLYAAGCGHSAQPPPAGTGACIAPAWTKLDVLAGQPGGLGWVDGTLVAAHFADPWTMAGDGMGHLYVADGMTIRAIDMTARTVATLAGGYAHVGGADGVGAQATFNSPSGIAFKSGQLYLTDTENHTIRVIDVQSGAVTTVAGASGQPGAVDAIGFDARFREPEGIALDESGNLYIGDTDNNTIRMLALGSGEVTTVAGTAGKAGTDDGVGATALFNKPKAVTLDSAGNLYVVDSLNQSIRKVEVATGTVSTLATFGVLSQGPIPQGVTLDGTDVLATLVGGGALVDNRVVRIASDGTVTTLAGGPGSQGFVDGAGANALFNGPAGLWNDRSGTVYVADNANYVLRAIDIASSTVSTYAGANSSGSADGIAGQARFASPQGLATDGRSAYVADTHNSTIRKVDISTGEVTTLAGGIGQPGVADGALGDARFNQPEGLALDLGGQELYVADTANRRIRRIDLTTGTVATLEPSPAPGDAFGGFAAPSGLALDRGHLFVTDYTDDCVLAIDLQKDQLSTLAGKSGAPGRADGIGSEAAFYGPLGIAADGRGNLYVADDLNETVRKIVIAAASVSTLAGQPVTPGSGDGVGSAAYFHYPFGIAADCAGDVFVSDTSNNAIRHIEASTEAVTTVIGTPSGAGVRVGALPAQISQPYALALMPSGELLVVSENALLVAH
jgi:sugar lactone lactonase YvrE